MANSLPANAKVTHVSLFDGSNEGIASTDRPAFSVQYHPEASPGPTDSHHLFKRFVGMMDSVDEPDDGCRQLDRPPSRIMPPHPNEPRIGNVNAQAHRHQIHHDHRRRPDRHRPGLRVRLFRRPGLQGAAGRGLPRHPGELQPRHHHDRSWPGGRHLYRADHARGGRKDHRPGEAGRAAADHGRPDRAEHGDATACQRRAANAMASN